MAKSMTSFSCSGYNDQSCIKHVWDVSPTYRVKVEDLDRPVILDGDVVQEDLHHSLEELPGLGVSLRRVAGLTDWPELCKKSVSNDGNIGRSEECGDKIRD